MPQSTYLPVYTAEYPILAKAQKPGGVTVLATVGAGDVPNKHVYAAGTIQMASLDADPEAAEAEVEEEDNNSETEEAEHEVEAEAEEPEEEHRTTRRSPKGRGRHHK